MSLAMTVLEHWDLGHKIFVIFSVVASANYAATGDTLNFNDQKIKSRQIPDFVSIRGNNGYTYEYVRGTTIANGKMKVSTTANTELAAGAYPAGITGDAIRGLAVFRKLR